MLVAIGAAGLEPVQAHYFNYLLFGPIWLARTLIRAAGKERVNENRINHPLINRILTWIFDLDVRTAPLLSPPFGASILVVARRAKP